MTPKRKIAIYGAGQFGIRLLDDILRASDMEIVAFFDDDAKLSGQRVHGYPVFAPKQIAALVLELGIQIVMLAIPSMSAQRRREILAVFSGVVVKVLILPDADELLISETFIDQLRNIRADDLLRHQNPSFDEALLTADVRGKSVMVTGGGGFIGSELCRQIVENGASRLVVVDSSEPALHTIKQKLEAIISRRASKVELISVLGDCTSREDMKRYMRDRKIETIYHAAAYKHVPLLERNPGVCVSNNVFGTWASAEAAIESGVSKFVLISPDTAGRPTNIMEASKRMAEMVLQGLHAEKKASRWSEVRRPTKLTVVRFCDIANSADSLASLLWKQIQMGGPVTLTSRKKICFLLTFPEAARLVLQAGSIAMGGEIFLLDKGKPVKIYDLASQLANLRGLALADSNNPDGEIQIEFTGTSQEDDGYEEMFKGDNISGTMHASVLKVEEPYLSWHEISRCLDDLKAALLAFDEDALWEIMIRTLEGYVAPESRFLKKRKMPPLSLVR